MAHPEVPEGYRPDPGERDGPSLTRRDLQDLRKAAGDGWAIPEAMRNDAMYGILQILTAGDTKTNRRLKLAAARTLAILERVDLTRARLGVKGLKVADLVAEAEAAAEAYTPETRPADVDRPDIP